MKNIFSRIFMSMLIVLLLTGFVNAGEVNYRNAYWECYCGNPDTPGNQASTTLLSDVGEVAVDGSNPSDSDDVTTTGWAYSNSPWGSHYGYYKSSAAYDGSLGIQLKGHGTRIESHQSFNTNVGTASVKTRMIDTDDGAPTTNFISMLKLYASDYYITVRTESSGYDFYLGIYDESGYHYDVIPGGCSHDNLDWWTYTIELNPDNYATFTVNDGTNTCSTKVYHGIDNKFTGYGVVVDKQGSGSQWAIADFDNLLFIGQEESTYDCAESYEGGPTSCKSSSTWKEYAEEFCEGHCYEDNSKCGVNSFKVWNECEKDIACKDSDYGENYYVKGILSSQYKNTYPPVKEDLCFNEIESGQEDLFPPRGNSDNTLLEYYCYEFENGDYLVEYYNCPNGCKDGACVKKTEQVKCVDSDGKNQYTRGTNKFDGSSTIEICVGDNGKPTTGEEGTSVIETWCQDGVKKEKVYACENGCKEGACVLEKKQIPHLFVVGDQSPAKDVMTIVDLISWLISIDRLNEGEHNQVLNSEVTREDLNDRVTTFIYKDQALIIVGDTSPSEDVMLATDVSNFLRSKKGIDAGATKIASEILYDDLRKSLPEEVPEQEIIIPEETMPREHSAMDCGDGYCDPNAAEMWRNCPEDCEKPKEPILEKEIKPTVPECYSGCITDHTCLPIGTRLIHEGKASYCNIDGNIEPQLGTNAQCMNYYECESNVCVNNRCMSGGLIQKIIDWFMRLFGK